MNKIVKTLSGALLTVLFTTSAMAFGAGGSLSSGWSVGATYTQMDIDAYGTEYKKADSAGDGGDTLLSSTTKANAVDVGSIFAEYTGSHGSTFGLEWIPGESTIGSGSRTDTKSAGVDTEADSGTYTAKANVKDHMTLYVEPTFMFTENFGLYAKGGVSRMKIVTLENLAVGLSQSDYPDKVIYGGTWGAGIKANHSSGVFIKIEATESVYQKYDEFGNGGTNRVIADIDTTQAAVKIGYNF